MKYTIYNLKYVNNYYGVTQDPITQDLVIIMPYYESDLTHYITKGFYNTYPPIFGIGLN
jgi:hypothetical protein